MQRRYPIIDVLRGVAIIAMMAYHFGFDLNIQGYITQDINHSLSWQLARSLILSGFLLLAGFSIMLARHSAAKKRWQRLARIAVCATLVSIGSYLMFPQSWIFFGVLHFMLLASLLCWFLVGREKWLLPLAFIALGLGWFYQSSTFDQPLWQCLGMMTHKPMTEDYVPMLPWIGVMLIGQYIGAKVLAKPDSALLAIRPITALKPVGWLGRHSLAVYMLHQPILLGLLSVYGAVMR
jgi:uncharacterized membrane protein